MLLDEHREVVLSDFGLALLLPHTDSMNTRPIDQSMSGTIPYMAPEQLQGNPESASDQYALGIVVYEWLCGRRPFSGSSIEIAIQHLSMQPPSMREQVPELSPVIEEVVLRALVKEPKERFACMQDFHLALEQASQEVLKKSFFSLPSAPEEEQPLPQQGPQILDSGGPKPEPIWKIPATFTPLVGREQDVTAIAVLLKRSDVRLLTLIGTGGVGKSRLSIQVAIELRDYFPDGICFVPLAIISDSALVIPSIAQALDLTDVGGRTEIDLLQSSLKKKNLLLLLDNFEQVVTAAPYLLDMLTVCPHLKILVTSRMPLHLHGEQQFPVFPLELPDLKELPEVDNLAQYAAVALFLQCAQAVKPAFHLTSANARAVVEICARLDGLPLAIELAASRIKLLPPHALLARLSQWLQLLTSSAQDIPARHHTLRNTIEWSYNLLDAPEQLLFRRISVFVGGCTLEAIEALYAATGSYITVLSALDGLSSLIDKSLLQQMGEEEEPRYIMLETVREFGVECLRESREVEAIQHIFAMYYLAHLEETEPHLEEEQQLVWLRRLEREIANIYTALETAFVNRMHVAFMRGVYSLVPFLLLRGIYSVAEYHLERAYETAIVLEDSRSTTTALLYLGEVAQNQGKYAQAETYWQEGLELAREMGDAERISALLNDLGWVMWKRGEYARAEAYLQEGLRLAREIDDKKRISGLLKVLGSVVASTGNYRQEIEYLQEGLAIARQIGDREQISAILTNLGVTAGEQGNYIQAKIYLQEGLALARQIGDREMISVLLSNLGETAGAQGNYIQAEIYFQEGLALARQIEHREWISVLLSNLGFTIWKQGKNGPAEEYFQEGLSLARQLGRPQITANILYEYSNFCLDQQHIEAAEAMFHEILNTIREGDQDLIALAQYGLARVNAIQGNMQEARKLGEASFTALEAIGHRNAKEVRDWLGLLPVSVPSILHPDVALNSPLLLTYPNDLTAREVEVLRLVATGLKNGQVAEQLVISPRTVNRHLTSIYRKIGISSRSAATRYALDHHLI
jgi:predicted ATPase/DNA-binding CsgD family transcriptional regulator/Tfp pilus assembly protein PilF